MNARDPEHVAIIMDGNGRWATDSGRPRLAGHRAGADSLRRVVTHCRELGLRFLTLYAFSSENWRRPPAEVGGLMSLLRRYLLGEEASLRRHQIELRVIGDTARLPGRIRSLLGRVVRTTRGLDGMRLTLALSYGGRGEIVRAVRCIAQQVARGLLAADQVDERLLERTLDTRDTPPPDLLIRTGGEQRLSNFLLWQAAYAELYFTQVAWPEFGPHDLEAALRWYRERQRTFGLVPTG